MRPNTEHPVSTSPPAANNNHSKSQPNNRDQVEIARYLSASRLLQGWPGRDYAWRAGLLADAISRTAQLGPEIGCRGLLVHAEAPQARDFYLHLIPEFEPSPTDDLHLVLFMKDILRTLRD